MLTEDVLAGQLLLHRICSRDTRFRPLLQGHHLKHPRHGTDNSLVMVLVHLLHMYIELLRADVESSSHNSPIKGFHPSVPRASPGLGDTTLNASQGQQTLG
ncbi:hypothetical protein MN608_09391 [Microdochium nivale]|nr:hypothetical protein MN608_09391 [Microdochium nivale]